MVETVAYALVISDDAENTSTHILAKSHLNRLHVQKGEVGVEYPGRYIHGKGKDKEQTVAAGASEERYYLLSVTMHEKR